VRTTTRALFLARLSGAQALQRVCVLAEEIARERNTAPWPRARSRARRITPRAPRDTARGRGTDQRKPSARASARAPRHPRTLNALRRLDACH